jgi:glycosyltransferase involved in cell wall biosynthesis
MKVLHLVYSGMGGSASVVFSFIEADKKKIFNNSILFSGPRIYNDYIKKSSKLVKNFSYIKTIKFISFFYYFQILKRIILYKPQIIFLHNYLIIPVILYKILFPKIKIIYINHTPLNKFSWRDHVIICISLFINRIICLNKETFFFLRKKFKSKLSKIVLITNGINTNFWFRNNIKKKNYFKIGMACRINKHKKYNLIINSLSGANMKNLNIKFSLAGIGENFNYLQKEIKSLNLEDKIKLEGYLDELKLKKWFRTLDLYIQASSGEGMSIALLQAMSMKVPVIGSDVTGIKNFIGKEKYLGLLFKNNIADLSKKIQFFYYLNKKNRIKFIKKQHEYIIKNHDYQKIFLKYLSVVKSLNI